MNRKTLDGLGQALLLILVFMHLTQAAADWCRGAPAGADAHLLLAIGFILMLGINRILDSVRELRRELKAAQEEDV